VSAVFRDVEDNTIWIFELAFEIALTLVPEIKAIFSCVGFDALLGFVKAVNLKAKVMGAFELLGCLEVRRLCALAVFEVQPREVYHIAYVNGGTNFHILSIGAFEIEHRPIEFASLVGIADPLRKVPETRHRTSDIRTSSMRLPMANDVYIRTRLIRSVSDGTFASQRALPR
jgi:hypothetical protein